MMLTGRRAPWPRGRTTAMMALPLLLPLLLILDQLPQARANGMRGLATRSLGDSSDQNATLDKGCTFPVEWIGNWYLHGKEEPVVVNSTYFMDRKCAERNKDSYLTEEFIGTEKCYRCMIFTNRTVNVIQYRESLICVERDYLDEICQQLKSDDMLFSMFRLDSEPIQCPLGNPPFSFSYNRGHGDCTAPQNQVESCTDNSKLLFKYQACADITGAESSTEELQCLATWKEGWNYYLLGTLKVAGNEKIYSCFLYEKIHRNGKTSFLMSQSADSSCNGLTSVNEGSRTFNFTREEMEHTRCKYPSWVTQHHKLHFLDGSRNYQFTTHSSTLKVTFNNPDKNMEPEEKVVCHQLEKMHPGTDAHGQKVKLVAHVTSGCDTGYVCMIFHKRDEHVIEVQMSSQKTIMPNEACLLEDPSTQPYHTLISSTLHKRSCPQPGRYTVLDLAPTPQLKFSRRHRRFSSRISGRSWKEDSNEASIEPDDCQNADVQIGCTSSGQNEMVIQESCKGSDIAPAYSCHGSWEEQGIWYTIVSRNKSSTEKETLCISMRVSETTKELPGHMGRIEQQELWLSRPRTFCQRGAPDQWTYKLANQGVCEDLMRAASSSASSSSLARVSVVLSIGLTLLCSILSR